MSAEVPAGDDEDNNNNNNTLPSSQDTIHVMTIVTTEVMNETDETNCCPICLHENVTLAKAQSCGHAFCIDCLEQFFSVAPHQTSNEEEHEHEQQELSSSISTTTTNASPSLPPVMNMNIIQDLKHYNIDNIPTIGRCPLCRNPISLLDMTTTNTNTTTKDEPIIWWLKNRVTNIEKTPLAGKIFAARHGIGYNSFHFPPFSNENTNNNNGNDTTINNPQIPYLLWKQDDALYKTETTFTFGNDDDVDEQQQQKEEEEEANDPTQQTKYYFEPGYFYFPSKQIFQGCVKIPDSHNHLQPYHVLLSFANNHKSITGGFLLQYYPSFKTQWENQHYYPLEGDWKVTWYSEQITNDMLVQDHDNNNNNNNNNSNNLSSLIIDTADVTIRQNSIHDISSIGYMIRYDESRIYFHWPGLGVTQTLEPECDFRKNKNNNSTTNNDNEQTNQDTAITIPAIGDYLKWTTTDPNQPYIVWQRKSIGPCPPTSLTSIEYLGRSGGDIDPFSSNYHTRRANQTWYREWQPSSIGSRNNRRTTITSDNNNSTIPQYHADQLWGNTFCQGLRVGLASYHFGLRSTSTSSENGEESQDSGRSSSGRQQPYAYISYENSMCSQWPPLDDGSPIPPQVFFHDISVETIENENDDNLDPANSDNTTRTSHVVFRGNIEWLQDYGTTWQNNERWEYEMVFDSQFTCIVSGTVHCITSAEYPQSPPSSRRQEMSQYGTDLVYINAGILGAFERWMSLETLEIEGEEENNANDNNDTIDAVNYRRYTALSRRIRRRLQGEGATVRTVAMLNMVFTMSLQPGMTSPIDYNLSRS